MTEEIRIESVQRQGKKYRVETTEGEHTLTEETIIKFLVLKGAVFTGDEFSKILAFDEENRLFDKALRHLATQSRSVSEMREYLKERTDAETGERIIARLLVLNYLDDAAFVQNLFDYAVRNFRGPKYLEARLEKSGIDSALIREVLGRYDEELEKKLISEYLEKRKDRDKDKPARKQKEMLFQKLLRAGFTYGAVNSALRVHEFVDESEAHLGEEIQRLEEKFSSLDERKKKEKVIRSLIQEGYAYDDIMLHLKGEE